MSMPAPLPAGYVLAARFAIESPVGQGGMAVVYRARDLLTEVPVAVKLLHTDTKSQFALEHFLLEAEILASLHHPHIVSYITHGRLPSGAAYLVMQWLDGEDLGQRLARGPLGLRESLQLVGLVADALGMAHRHGVVHRDLKPSNLFLRHCQISQITLLDFGVARRLGTTRALTKTGLIVGTPEYMAPEQVRGERTVGPAADLFALGCVLYECLSGCPPFLGEPIVAVLAQILFEEAPDIRTFRPGVPTEVVALLAKLLAKTAAERIPDGMALVDALSRLPAYDEATVVHRPPAAPPAIRPSGLRGELQELLSVVVASSPDALRQAGETVQVATREVLADSQLGLLKGLRGLGAHAEFLVDGSLVVVVRRWSSATDQAVLAAQAALLIREHWSGVKVAVTTGRGLRPGELPMGEALNRAARLLAADNLAGNGPETRGGVLLDEVTAGLVSGCYEVQKNAGGLFLLQGVRAALDESRPLLGKPTPCVGRERELTQLKTMLATTIEEPLAQAVVITGPPGSGKSRLRHEFLRRLQTSEQEVLVLVGRGAALSMGTAFGLLGQALRGLCGVLEGDSAAERRRRFSVRIGMHLSAEQAAHAVPLLAEMSHLEGDPEGSPQVRAAHQDPAVVHEQLAYAFIDFLRAECAAHPVLLILEDLHWGDAPSVRLVDTALRALSEQPLMVVALARPEVHELFPKLWQRRVQTLALWGLGQRACERLIRGVLGPRVTPELEGRIIAQAAGNALFLEELIRAVADGKTESIPETVLAMLQARLSQLGRGARVALCAASIFGSVFWGGGVAVLLGDGPGTPLSERLPELVELELIQSHPTSRVAGQVEYGFRHDLMRDAAYTLLSDEDRVLGHYLAGQFLEGAGERDALTLAEHYRRGEAPAQAIKWYHQAAEQALEVNELKVAQGRAQSALDAGAQGAVRGQLYGLQAAAAYWQRDDSATRQYAEQAMEFLAPGTPDWYQCAAHLLVSSGRLRDWAVVTRWLDTVLAAAPESGALAARILCLSRTGFMFMLQGRAAEMKRLAEQLAEGSAELPDSEPAALAQLNHFRSGYAATTGDWAGYIRYLEAAIAAFERAGDQRNALLERSQLTSMYVELGVFPKAEQLGRFNLAQCERSKFPEAHTLALLMLGYALTFFPDQHPEARQLLAEAITRSAATQNRRHQGWAQSALTRLEYVQGRFAAAVTHARLAIELLGDTPTFQCWPLGWLARALVRQGQAAEGLACADQAMATLKKLGGFTMGISVPPLAQIEALQAMGQAEAAAPLTSSAKRRLLRRAETISDPDWRARFLDHPDNTPTLALPDP